MLRLKRFYILQDKSSPADTLSLLSKRATNVRQACSRPDIPKILGFSLSRHSKYLIVNDKKKVMFCFVPKVACTNFKRVFLGLEGVVPPQEVDKINGYDIHFTHLHRLKFLEDFDTEERNKITRTYKKFIFVRDPFERLVSGFRNKFVNHPNPDSKAVFLGHVESLYTEFPQRGKDRNIRKVRRRKTLTFQDFLYFILDQSELKGEVNAHFAPVVTLCNPCKINFDYIGYYDNLNEEADIIFKNLSIDYSFPARNDNYSSVVTKHIVEDYYKMLPSDLVRAIWDIFKKDYITFDLPIPDWLLKFNIEYSSIGAS